MPVKVSGRLAWVEGEFGIAAAGRETVWGVTSPVSAARVIRWCR